MENEKQIIEMYCVHTGKYKLFIVLKYKQWDMEW